MDTSFAPPVPTIMRALFTLGDPLRCELKEVSVPRPGPREVLIRVVFCASNPRDWKAPEHLPNEATRQGVEMAGIVEFVGYRVWEFRRGDRVAALKTSGGAYADFATASVNTCFHIPLNMTMEEASTIPYPLCTAALGLYQRLQIPFPTSNTRQVNPPLIVYGASLPVGAFTLKLARLSQFTKIIAVCKTDTAYVESLGVATHIIKYEDENLVDKIKEALDGEKCYHAVDAINDGTSWEQLTEILEPDGSGIAVSHPRPDYTTICDGITVGIGFLGAVNGQWTPFQERGCQEDLDFIYLLFRMLTKWIVNGTMTGHPFHLLSYGLKSVEAGLNLVKKDLVTLRKLVIRTVDTVRCPDDAYECTSNSDDYMEW